MFYCLQITPIMYILGFLLPPTSVVFVLFISLLHLTLCDFLQPACHLSTHYAVLCLLIHCL